MNISAEIWNSPVAYLAARRPEQPVHFFHPETLRARAALFARSFPGLASYAVKANPDPAVIDNLLAAGISAFDVASPNEIRLIRSRAPDAVLHYNNPARSKQENVFAYGAGVRSFSVDSLAALEKLRALENPAEIEISVRFKLPVAGAVYDFGTKFGAEPDKAAAILAQAAQAGFRPSITFHPGTQCEDPDAWAQYIAEAGRIARTAGITLHRLNVGGGFPAQQAGQAPDLRRFFDIIARSTAQAFPENTPALVCEPGRAMVAEAFAHAVCVRDINDEGALFLNDGIYGGLSEFPVLPIARRHAVLAPDGTPRRGPERKVTVFGPTCDSLDVLPGEHLLPETVQEGDYILIHSMGAYVNGVTTAFNGYGNLERVTVLSL